MNRSDRRALQRAIWNAVVPGSVALIGGPMDGWAVEPDAPALRPDWHETWNVNVAPSLANWEPGRYVQRDGNVAEWQELP